MNTDPIKLFLNGKYPFYLPSYRAKFWMDRHWEEKRLDSMVKNLSYTDILYYVGAEEGDMPALFSSLGITMVLFEPDPLVWPNIKLVYEQNSLPAPLCFVGFAGNMDTGGEISSGFPHQANGPVCKNHGFKELATQSDEFPVVTIDTAASITGLSPTAISLDVEGSEFEVLKGAERVIDTHHPKIWLSLHPEFLFRQYNMYAWDVRYWLQQKGYTEELLDYQHEVHLFYHI